MEDLLILTKTYPGPSAKYRETTCVAALNSEGRILRLYPVPFRLLEGAKQFRKWEWIQAHITRATGDNRPESHRIDVDSLVRTNRWIGTRDGWAERRNWIAPHIVTSFSELEARRQRAGQTLGFLRPCGRLRLEITPQKETEWTDKDLLHLSRDGLFDAAEARNRPLLRKLPFTFHYCYECAAPTGQETLRHMITDWEVGMLFWNCQRRYGAAWEDFFRAKLEREFAERDLHFLMGTVHRFPDQWLIVGLFYPPRPKQAATQLSLGSPGS